MRWRLLIDERPRTGAENMAVDQALLESVQAGGRPALRLYRWDPPCLSLGRNQPVPGPEVAAAASARRVHLVRRPTGGMAVYHDRELTYAVAVPVGVVGSPRETYRAINRALVAGLRRLGVPAGVVPEGRGGAPRDPASWAAPCFEAAAPGEVVVAGRKLVGSAQRCERRTLLQHGSLLLEGDQREAAELLSGVRPGRPANGLANLTEVLGYTPAWADLVGAIREGFEEALGVRLEPAPPDAGEEARASALVHRFRSEEWTLRR